VFLGLAESWQRFAADEDARVAILTGTENSFCAGMDIKERLASGEPGLGLPKIPVRDPFWFEELEKPTVAAINGYALGGGFFLASRADFRIAVPSALFQITEVVRGNIAGYEAVLTRENLPYAVAAELAAGGMLTGGTSLSSRIPQPFGRARSAAGNGHCFRNSPHAAPTARR